MHRTIPSTLVLVVIWLLTSVLAIAPARSALPTAAHTTPAPQSQQATNTFSGTATTPGSATFTSTGSPQYGGGDHPATLLKNGKVLVVGGKASYDDTASAELYDPDSGTFSITGSMARPRLLHTATLLENGKVLVVGGYDSGSYHSSAELYDPATGSFSATGSLAQPRTSHTATLLENGKVLIVGGYDSGGYLSSVELYDPATDSFSATGGLAQRRPSHTATLLENGKVLIVGGHERGSYHSSAELYDPATGSFSATGSLVQPRTSHTATLLENGKVLIVGGYERDYLSSAELYDPATDSFSATGSLAQPRTSHTATLLPSGRALIVGGITETGSAASAELYDPATGTFSLTGKLKRARCCHSAVLLPIGGVLIVGGYNSGPESIPTAEIATVASTNIFTGSLTLPSAWITTLTTSVSFSGTTTGAALVAGGLSNDATTWGNWIGVAPDESVTTAWSFGGDGANKPVYLRLRDRDGRAAIVVRGTVDVDTTPPTSTMTALPSFSSSTLPLSWSGADTASGIASYDVEVRQGSTGEWTPVLTDTTTTSASYTAMRDSTYYFRVRATDVAGHVEPWPDTYDTSTVVDTEAPTGTVVVNGGALATTTQTTTLTLAATDARTAIVEMRFGNDGATWGSWQPYVGTATHVLPTNDGVKAVYAQFRDAASNLSTPVSNTIRLNEAAGVQRLVSINTGAVWTNTATVTLAIGAPGGTAQMQMSNDGGFGGAKWQPFDTHPTWTINSYGSYVLPRTVYIRLRGSDGTISGISSDDIIYDPVPPTGAIAIVTPTTVNPASTSVQVKLSASDPDNLSGVAAMRVAPANQMEHAAWEPYATSKTVALDEEAASDGRVCAQFRDGAGNLSETTCADASEAANIVYLPLLVR